MGSFEERAEDCGYLFLRRNAAHMEVVLGGERERQDLPEFDVDENGLPELPIEKELGEPVIVVRHLSKRT